MSAAVPSSAPVVIIAIVNFNSGDWLRRCVAAALASTVPVAVQVGDNGSIDDSVARLRAAHGNDPRLAIMENGANLGFGRALNRLLDIDNAAVPWRLVLNPDCRIEPDTLARLLAVLADFPKVGMAGPLIVNPDGSEQRGCRRHLPTFATSALRSLGLGKLLPTGKGNFDLTGTPLPPGPVPMPAISGAFMLLRQTALAEVGGMDEGYFLHCEDVDWCARFQQAGWPILFVPNVMVMHEQGTCSVSRPWLVEWHKHRCMLRYSRKFEGPLLALLVAPLVWARFALIAARIAVRRLRK